MTLWHDAKDPSGRPTQEFRLETTRGRDVTGALWLSENGPEEGLQKHLVCFGHGASGNRYQPPITHLAGRFIELGMPVLSIDGPVHGLRQQGEGGRTAFGPELARQTCVEDMIDDWQIAITEAQGHRDVGITPLAYFGLSMGSIFGIPLVAARDDMTVATLGLLGISGRFPHGNEVMAAAANITCPLLFLMQLEDELFERRGYLELFDAMASDDKRLHANPGLHPEVPTEEINFSFDFMVAHLGGSGHQSPATRMAE